MEVIEEIKKLARLHFTKPDVYHGVGYVLEM